MEDLYKEESWWDGGGRDPGWSLEDKPRTERSAGAAVKLDAPRGLAGVYSLLMFATVLPFCSFCLRTLLPPAFSLGKAPAGTVNLLRACAWPSRLPSRPPQPPQPHRKDGPAPASALYPAHVMLASAVWHAPDSLPERGGPGICPAS